MHPLCQNDCKACTWMGCDITYTIAAEAGEVCSVDEALSGPHLNKCTRPPVSSLVSPLLHISSLLSPPLHT